MSLGAGCTPGGAPAETERTAEAAQAINVLNGELLNGTRINGTRINGTRINGTRINGTTINGTRINGSALEGDPEGSGITLSGLTFTNVDLDAEFGDSTEGVIHIESASDTVAPGFFTYEFTFKGENVCGDPGAMSIVVPGTWDYVTATHIDDPTRFTIACLGAAIAKCEVWGYPRENVWGEINGTVQQQISFSYFHDACTRMVRADYCGDGVPHTVDGTLIDIWDAMGVETETPTSGLVFEAEWSPQGATCIHHARWGIVDGVDTVNYILSHPDCSTRWTPASTDCGGDETGGSTFFTSNGFSTDPAHRALLRNASTPN